MPRKKKPTRGGARQGAGRKTTTGTPPNIVFRAPNRAEYERAAKAAGKILTAWIVESLDARVNQPER